MGETEIRKEIKKIHKDIYETHDPESWGLSTVWTLFKVKSKEFLLKYQKRREKEAEGELKVVERLLTSLAATADKRHLKNYEINARVHLRKELQTSKRKLKIKASKALSMLSSTKKKHKIIL